MVFRGKSMLLFKRMRLASPNPLDDLETLETSRSVSITRENDHAGTSSPRDL